MSKSKKKITDLVKNNEWNFKYIKEVLDLCEDYGKNWLGYDLYDNQVEIITSEQMLDAYASSGLPIMYDHWKFGKDYSINKNKYIKGQMNLAYEIVLNSNPCISYNMEDNTAVMTALVIAHAAIGHNAFFKNNYMFKEWTDANTIIDYLTYAKDYIKSCEEKWGEEEVEDFLDSCHALQFHGIDKYIRRYKSKKKREKEFKERKKEDQKLYNPVIDETIKKSKDSDNKIEKFPQESEENLLYFIEKYSPKLKNWQREIIRIVRKIGQYFYPQIQTKVINEGCLTEGSLIDTENGLLDIKDIVKTKYSGKVWDGEKWEFIYDWFENKNKKRIKIITDKGYTIFGGENHKIYNDEKWIKLSELNIGDTLIINKGGKFPKDYINIEYNKPEYKFTIKEACDKFGTNITTYKKWSDSNYKFKIKKSNKIKCEKVNNFLLSQRNLTQSYNKRINYNLPKILNENLAYWLGCLIGDGNVSKKNRIICLTTGDDELKEKFNNLTIKLFGYKPKINKYENRWRIKIYSQEIIDYLRFCFQIKIGKSSSIKEVPDLILKSPENVVASFIKGHFDTDGCVSSSGLVLVSNSYKLLKKEQELLLKIGIYSSLKENNFEKYDKIHKLYINSKDSIIFRDKIGFFLERKKEKLNDFINSKKYFINKPYTTKIIKIEEDYGTTYDFSVSNSHKYQSGGFINHNCATFTHYQILNKMHEDGYVDEGFILEFLQSHTSVVFQPEFDSPYFNGSFNPYALGFAMFMDIKRICENPTKEDKEWFPDLAGGDWKKEVMYAVKNFKDETFILQYLSPKVIRDFKMFYILDDYNDRYYEVEKIHNERGYKEIRKRLSQKYNWNNMFPDIQIESVDILGDRKLNLIYTPHNEMKLDEKNKKETLKHLEKLWGYEVILKNKNDEGEDNESENQVEFNF